MLSNYSILVGPVRLMVLCLFIFFLNKYVIKYVKEKNIIDYVVNRWVKYSCSAILIVFILVQLNIYDTFNTLLILAIIIAYKFLKFNGFSNFFSHLKKMESSILLYSLKKIEQGKLTFIKYNQTLKKPKGLPFYFIAIIGLVVFISRIFFYKYDLYTLSEFWFEDLKMLNDLQQQQWISGGRNMMGEYALISLFSKLTGINPEMAIQSFSIIESSIFAIIIYWFTSVLTKSKYIAPVISSLSFGLLFFLIPINVNFITQHNKTLLALSMLFPFMVYFVNPKSLGYNNKKNTFYLFLYFTTITLIDLFSTVIILPLFLLTATFIVNKNFDFIKKTYGAYFVAVLLVISIYGIGSYQHGFSFKEFIFSNLVSLRTIEYTPQLLFPLKKLMVIYHIISLFNLLILFLNFYKTKKTNHALFIFLILFNLLVGLNFLTTKLDIWFIDKDLILQTMTLFLSILFGITVSSISNFIQLFIQIKMPKKHLKPISIFIITLFLMFFYKGYKISNLKNIKTAKSAKKILQAYYTISNTFLPYSYTVVNAPKFQPISRNKHFFIGHQEFIEKYPKQDSIYFDHSNDKEYLKKHPQIILPASVLIFIEKRISTENKELNTKDDHHHHHHHGNEEQIDQKNITTEIEQILNNLISKGRKIEIFFDDQNLKIVEIINRPKSAKINELLF